MVDEPEPPQRTVERTASGHIKIPITPRTLPKLIRVGWALRKSMRDQDLDEDSPIRSGLTTTPLLSSSERLSWPLTIGKMKRPSASLPQWRKGISERCVLRHLAPARRALTESPVWTIWPIACCKRPSPVRRWSRSRTRDGNGWTRSMVSLTSQTRGRGACSRKESLAGPIWKRTHEPGCVRRAQVDASPHTRSDSRRRTTSWRPCGC